MLRLDNLPFSITEGSSCSKSGITLHSQENVAGIAPSLGPDHIPGTDNDPIVLGRSDTRRSKVF